MQNDVHGWILDAHLCSAQQEMLVWIATEQGPVVSFREPWHPVIYVAGRSENLQNLVDWLWQPEICLRYGLRTYAFEMKRPELGSLDAERMLSITLESCATLRSLAEHIDARGEHVRFTLYSVDVRAEQQYLTAKRLTIGSPVRIHRNELTLLDRNYERRNWRCCRMEVILQQFGQGPTACRQPIEIHVAPCDTLGNLIGTESTFSLNEPGDLSLFEQWFHEFDPDLLLSIRGNTEGFPHLMSYLEARGQTLCLGRNQTPLRQVGRTRILS